jgi:hypothetical protein
MIKSTVIRIFLSSVLTGTLFSCSNPFVSTQSQTTEYTTSINTFNKDRQLVAIYKFTQTSTYSTSSNSQVILDVENVTNSSFCVAYTIYFSLNQASWTHQGYVRNIEPRATVRVGVISKNPARVDLGSFLIRFDTDLLTSC